MSYEIREGQGSLCPNENRKSDNAPNATGRCNIGGTIYRLSAWTKTTRDGQKWMSPAIEVDARGSIAAAENRNAEIDEDLPF